MGTTCNGASANHLRNVLQVLYDTCKWLCFAFSWVKGTVLLIWNLTCWPFSRGQFQILQTAVSSEFYDGLEAQPPCIVNKKAYKFSTEMPSVLQLESLPVLNALTDIFQDNSPRLQDIALYFFPSELTERSAFTSYFDDPFFFLCRPGQYLLFMLLILHVLNWM